MRTAFIQALCGVAERDPNVWLLCGDLGYSVLEEFATRFPDRFVNVGVAEQNMTGMAAGLAMCGKTVFTYSIANFPVLRCLEQIRNDVCYHDLNVKVVAVGGGVSYGPQGYTHHGVEDLAVMRTLPNMVVLAPGDPAETRLATEAVSSRPGPCYLRLGKAGEPRVHEHDPSFQIGKAITVRPGTDVTLISTGAMLKTAVEASEVLLSQGISAQVLSMPTIKPFDEEATIRAAQETRGIVCLEEHRAPGALYEAVASVLVKNRLCLSVAAANLGEEVMKLAQSQEAYREIVGLTPQAIAQSARTLIA